MWAVLSNRSDAQNRVVRALTPIIPTSEQESLFGDPGEIAAKAATQRDQDRQSRRTPWARSGRHWQWLGLQGIVTERIIWASASLGRCAGQGFVT